MIQSTRNIYVPDPKSPAYLLIIHGTTSLVQPLPLTGTMIVGRDPSLPLWIDSAAISRRHAQFIISKDEILVVDLESRNGTKVNGERISDSRPLASGDVVVMGDVVFVFRRDTHVDGRQILDFKQGQQRLVQEIERARRYDRALSILAVSLGSTRCDRTTIGAKAYEILRSIDIVVWASASQLLVFLLEFGEHEARNAGTKLIAALGELAPTAQAGLACYPEDGPDADSLISAARAALSKSADGTIGTAGDRGERLTFGDRTILLADPAMTQIFALVRRLAARDMPILVLGENGTGKESVAAAIHHWSPRANFPFVAVNCATLGTLDGAELFGHAKGAFTDAKAARPGLLETANGGTLFLDEIGELPKDVQPNLLRVLETKRFRRIGEDQERETDIRIVAATNRDLAAESHAGQFREDLFFRIRGASINLPPLRHRPREIPILARMFLAQEQAKYGEHPLELSEATLQLLASHPWRGNVRELKNAMLYAAAMAVDGMVEPWHLPHEFSEISHVQSESSSRSKDLAQRRVSLQEEVRQLEIRRIKEALDEAGGVQYKAAEILGMPQRTFTFKLQRYSIEARTSKRPPSPGL